MQQPTLDVSICPCCGSISLATIEMDAILVSADRTAHSRTASSQTAAPQPQSENSSQSEAEEVLTDASCGQLFFECSRCHWQGSTATVNVI